MFTGLSSLKKLTINGFQNLTGIVSLPASLEYADLKRNKINVIEPDAFRLSNMLKYLYLDSNKLTAEMLSRFS
jgi:Leucine-rich repeat (LRR) protein